MSSTPGPHAPQGFVLVLVLWVLLILSVLAAGIAVESRTDSQIVHNRLRLARVRADADAGVMLAITGLQDPDAAARWLPDGNTRAIEYDVSKIAITVEDEGGKIDINTAPSELIGGLLDEFGVDGNRRAIIVDAILARRKAFTPPPGPMNDRRFREGPPPFTYDPTDLPFATQSEIRRLDGMSRDIYARVKPYITVYSQTATVNPMTASRPVLLAVPGVTTEDVDFLLASRAAGDESVSNRLQQMHAYLAPAEIRAVTIIARAETADGAAFARRAVISLVSLEPSQPMAILQWQQADDAPVAGNSSNQ